MATTSTRKELADNMRCFDVVSDAGGRYWLNGTLFGMDISARSEDVIRCGMDRLAGLIEPDDHFADTGEKVDRETLLALAGEMEVWALTCDHYDRQVSPLDVAKYARCIRKACGVKP